MVMPAPPYAEGGAAGRCVAGTLKGLSADERVELTAIAASLPAAGSGALPSGVAVDIVAVPRQNRVEAWTDLVRRPLGHLSRGEFGDRVRRLAAAADVLHLDQVQTAWCDLGTSVPSLVHLHYLVDLDRPGASPDLRAAIGRFGLAAAERRAVQRHRFLVANSSVVADELRRRAPRADVTVVPLALDPDRYSSAVGDVPPTAGFIGTATWPTTAAAARRLVERVWPLVHRELPGAKLVVAGRGMSDLGLTATEGVEIVGEVASAPAFLRGVSVLLFPGVRGSGTKVKVLEALACGVPVVTSATGAEGIAANDGMVVAEDDETLARAAVSILRDAEERKQRGAAARRAFDEGHTPTVAAGALVELYVRMTDSR
jgi:glycosyltransferase involved in cell wall biosynthesis